MFPATTDRFAEPLDGDDADAALVRPLMAGTRLERAPLRSDSRHSDPLQLFDMQCEMWRCNRN